MSVTNNIRDEVSFNSDTMMWNPERPLSNDEIIEALNKEKKDSFLSFAYGVWVTAYARNNLLRNVLLLDDYVIYCDTDSIKLAEGYDKNVIINYNKFVEKKIEYVSKLLDISIDKYSPKDVTGEKHMLGLFDLDAHYEQFITQGAKKYAYTKYKKNSKIKKDDNVIKRGKEKSLVLEITVSGVPKKGAKVLKKLDDFRDDLVFPHKYTNKNLVLYTENQQTYRLRDYKGFKYEVSDISGCCVLPTTYVLGKSEEYAELIEDSSARSVFDEGGYKNE